ASDLDAFFACGDRPLVPEGALMRGCTVRGATAALGFLLAWGLAGCGGDGGAADDGSVDALVVSAALAASEAEWREARREALLAEDGWTSLVGLHWLELRAHYVGSAPTSGIRLALGPPKLGLVQQEGGRVWFTPEAGVDVLLDEAPVKGRIELRDAGGPEPTELVFDEGRGRLSLI